MNSAISFLITDEEKERIKEVKYRSTNITNRYIYLAGLSLLENSIRVDMEKDALESA